MILYKDELKLFLMLTLGQYLERFLCNHGMGILLSESDFSAGNWKTALTKAKDVKARIWPQRNELQEALGSVNGYNIVIGHIQKVLRK